MGKILHVPLVLFASLLGALSPASGEEALPLHALHAELLKK
jgi:hypothetical protein